MGNPWEIARHDVSYPIKFFGKVESRPDGTKRWVGGEDVKAIAYDVPIPGYKTKTTLNLRLWSTEVQAEDFDLQAFTAGEHNKAMEAQINAAKVGLCQSSSPPGPVCFGDSGSILKCYSTSFSITMFEDSKIPLKFCLVSSLMMMICLTILRVFYYSTPSIMLKMCLNM
jgi:hypothetical protein